MIVTSEAAGTGQIGSRRSQAAVGACAALLAVFAILSLRAVSTKSATTDEPLHAVGAYVRLFDRDFRVNPEDPPLFGYWAMLGQIGHTLKWDTRSPLWHGMIANMGLQFDWVPQVCYFTAGNDIDAFIARSRMWMLAWGLALGAVLAWWSWKLAGAAAAIASLYLFAFDPSFLGHGPLIKNDVPVTLMIFATAVAVWSVGRHATVRNVLLLGLLAGVAANVKFSGFVAFPMVVATLIVRALLPQPWLFAKMPIDKLGRRIGAIVLMIGWCAAACWIVTWASYGFRYSATQNPAQHLNIDLLSQQAAQAQWEAGEKPGLFIDWVRFLDSHHLMPNAWSAGMLNTYAQTRRRNAFLLGEIRTTGWWYYFPLAMLFKTPTATLLCFAGVAGVAAAARRRGRALHAWDRVCIGVPLLVYGAAAVTSNLNLGLRHVLPLYPFLFVLVGVTFARMWGRRRRQSAVIGLLLAVGLAVETLAAYPNFIAFFNFPSGGARNGINLLGDSNLDWGQDLLLLRDWQRKHPDTRLYAAIFGTADPGHFVRYTPLPGNEYLPARPQPATQPGVAAISASTLQGITLSPSLRLAYARLRENGKPIDVLGGTIYLYPTPNPLLPDWPVTHE